MREIELDQVSIWEVTEPTKIMVKDQEEIKKIKFSWYRGGFFEINSVTCNFFTIEIENNIKKITYVIDRYGVMDEISFETEIPRSIAFWKNINKIMFSQIEINVPRNAFAEDRFCIKANGERILAGHFVNKKKDKNLVKFLKFIDFESALNKSNEIIVKYTK